jgi:hypothetical protein
LMLEGSHSGRLVGQLGTVHCITHRFSILLWPFRKMPD